MADINYSRLYELQDSALACVFNSEREFYLTGGTCLSRFYLEKRYSDDLDFFSQNSPRFSFAIKNIKTALQRDFLTVVEVETKQFVRFKINDLLQLDFVNDISARLGEVIVTDENYLIDSIGNILSNKLTAVIGRDNPKDIFDIFMICKYYSFPWKEILDSAHDKAGFSNEDLVVRMKSFPRHLLGKINIIDHKFLDDFDVYYPQIIEEIIQIRNHVGTFSKNDIFSMT